MIVLIAEDEADIVVVDFRVDEESSLEVDAAERVVTDSKSRVGVLRLHNFGALVVDHPVGVDLRLAFRIEHHRLIRSEIRREDPRVVRAVVEVIRHFVVVVVLFTTVSDSIVVCVYLIWVVDESAVVVFVQDSVVVNVRIASVTFAVIVGIELIRVGDFRAVVLAVLNTVAVSIDPRIAGIANQIVV